MEHVVWSTFCSPIGLSLYVKLTPDDCHGKFNKFHLAPALSLCAHSAIFTCMLFRISTWFSTQRSPT